MSRDSRSEPSAARSSGPPCRPAKGVVASRGIDRLAKLFGSVHSIAEPIANRRRWQPLGRTSSVRAQVFIRANAEFPARLARSVLTLFMSEKTIAGLFRGGVPKRPTGADCKSAGFCLRRFESYPLHQ